ncbi:hypothetical protein CROQUDRAFT_703071 [Cronartium quercuum f. sp. fusiforme G11]|uniref:J domain-containing protein n=1 Tax=Cronartium quercuum f. sp. fusiforme G11 TaxID=708437 RepID=A0A9P6TC30_9BASI|nr:hypothetical protein CROQUDRAFT_703071 [Cronartium quercuum f. sp. fusiforme G11]
MKTAKHLLFYFSAFMILSGAHPQPLKEVLKNSVQGVVNFFKKEAQDVVDHLNGLHNKPIGDISHKPMKSEASKPLLEKVEESGDTSQQPEIHEVTQENSKQSNSAKPVAPIQNNWTFMSSAQLMAQRKKDARPSPSLLHVESKKPKIDYHGVLGIEKPKGITKDQFMEKVQSAFKKKAFQTIPYYNPHDDDADKKFGRIVVAYKTLTDPEWKAIKNPEGKKETLKNALDYADGVFTTLFGGFEHIIGSASFHVRQVIAGELEKNPLKKGFFVSKDDAHWAHYPSSYSVQVQSINPEMIFGPESFLRNIPGKDTSDKDPSNLFSSAKVYHLSQELIKKLSTYIRETKQQNEKMMAETSSKTYTWQMEIDMLAKEHFGPEILQVVGRAYLSTSKTYLCKTSLGYAIEWTKVLFRQILEGFRTLGAQWNTGFRIKEVSKSPARIPREERLESKTRYAEVFLKAIYMRAMFETTVTLHKACARVVLDPGLSAEEAKERALALGIIGEAYLSVGKKPGKDTFKVSQLMVKEYKRNAPTTSNKGKKKLK